MAFSNSVRAVRRACPRERREAVGEPVDDLVRRGHGIHDHDRRRRRHRGQRGRRNDAAVRRSIERASQLHVRLVAVPGTFSSSETEPAESPVHATDRSLLRDAVMVPP